jgi:hypothetical protein
LGSRLPQLAGNNDTLWPQELSADFFYQLSYGSSDRLVRTVDLFLKLRRSIDVFNRSILLCGEDNETRIAVVDFLDPVTNILTDSIAYLLDIQSRRSSLFTIR